MPNHITNIVRICDTKQDEAENYEEVFEQFKKFALNLRNNESDFDFNAVIPMPENSATFFAQGGLGAEERKLFGSNNWYDWSVTNWGTKWNSYDVKYIKAIGNEDTYGSTIMVKFETAWSPPIPVLEAIARLGYEVTHAWSDEDGDEWHGFNLINGEEE